MQEKFLYFTHVVKTIRDNSSIVIEPTCNAWTVINVGATPVEVNSIPLNAGVPGTNNGESVSFGGNKGEVFKGRIEISFPDGLGGKAIVIQKNYLL